ncbi:MAG: beta-galactosidase, partial [Clostridia bacterium]|nr:beta-galactosidase [Clostridia bacterium]
MKRIICFILVAVMCMTVPIAYATEPLWGDVNASGKVDATDALNVLQHVVGKINLTDTAAQMADVDGVGGIAALDALQILQHVVGKLDRFPADTTGMTEEDIYYATLDRYYGVNGKDFRQTNITDSEDTATILAELGTPAQPSDIEGHALNEESNVIYNPISSAAKKQGTLSQYNTARKTKGSVKLTDGTTLTYEVPTNVTAYTAVPLKYTLQGGEEAQKVHVEANTWEEPARLPKGMTEYYSNTLPGKADVTFTYDGYVCDQNADNQKLANWSATIVDDKMGTAYPHYDTADLVKSDTIPAGKQVWLRFTFTNSGNTVLKGEGQGFFNIRPFLYKEIADGVYSQVAINDNYAYRLYDALYPGESRSIWVRFTDYASYPVGNYKAVLEAQVANEQGAPDWIAMYVGGRSVSENSFAFTAAVDGKVTDPNPVVKECKKDYYGNPVQLIRNGWLGVYEEFQTSYHTYCFLDSTKPKQNTLYFQPAPWDTTLTLRVLSDTTGSYEIVTLPLHVESDSIRVNLNPYNKHYLVKDDGTREPLFATQNMADMRGNNQDSPYPFDTMVNDLLDMKEAGVNYLTSTMAFTYETGISGFANASNRIMMDLVSLMDDFKFEPYGNYTYESSINKQGITKPFAGITTADGNNKMNGALNNWTYQRFGDTFFSFADGTTPIAQEDSRGWLTIDHDWRMDLDEATVKAFQQWLKEYYGDIAKLNEAYESEYTDFSEIDPRAEGLEDSGHLNFTNLMPGIEIFHERSKAMVDLDLFRTVNRTRDYKEALSVTNVPGAKMLARYEGSPIIAVGLKATTNNTHYREAYYQMYRAGLVGEIMAASNEVAGVSTYQNTPFTPAETYELTKSSTRAGLTVFNYHMHHRDQIYNTFYGDKKASINLRLKNSDMRVTSINTYGALFPVLKATYEAG